MRLFAIALAMSGILFPYSGHARPIVCPATDFARFIDAYANDIAIQKAFTSDLIRKQHLDLTAEPEPKMVSELLHRDVIRFPILPLRAERTRRALKMRFGNVNARSAKFVLFKPDTDEQVEFFFQKNRCWILMRIDDTSL